MKWGIFLLSKLVHIDIMYNTVIVEVTRRFKLILYMFKNNNNVNFLIFFSSIN